MVCIQHVGCGAFGVYVLHLSKDVHEWNNILMWGAGRAQSTSYLASVTLKGGKVFALFVKSPTKTFTADETKLRSVISSFKTV